MKKKIIFIGLIVLFITSCSIGENLDRVNISMNREKYRLEEKILRIRIKMNGDDKKLYDRLVDVYKKNGKDKKAVLEEGIERFDSLEYRKLLALVYKDEKKYKEAIELYKDILSMEKSPRNYKEIFSLFEKVGLDRELLLYFEKEKEYIEDPLILLEVGLLYVDLGNEERGRQIVAEVEGKDLKDIRAYELLAEYYYKINDFENSLLVAKKGLELGPKESILHGYVYGYVNSDGWKLQKIYSEDVNGDGSKENIIILADKDSMLDSGNIILTIQDGRTGNLLGKKRLEEYVFYSGIKFLDFDGDGVKDIYISKYIEDEKPIRPDIYKFIKNDFKLLTTNYDYNDIEFLVKDGFKLEVYSKKQKKKEIIDLGKDKDKYIGSSLFNQAGKVVKDNLVSMTDSLYQPIYDKKLKRYNLRERHQIVIEDIEIAEVDTIYSYDSNFMKISKIDISSNYKIKSEEYKGETAKSIGSLNEREVIKIFAMKRSQIISNYENPKKIDYLNGEILDYNGIQFYMEGENVKEIRVLNSRDVFGLNIPASYDDIISKMGKPNEEVVGKDYVDEYELVYKRGKGKLKFNGIKDKDDSFILFIYN